MIKSERGLKRERDEEYEDTMRSSTAKKVKARHLGKNNEGLLCRIANVESALGINGEFNEGTLCRIARLESALGIKR